MKCYNSILLPLLLLLCSCQKDPFLTVNSPKSYSFTDEGGSQYFSFSCNRDWSISSSEAWIRVHPSSGSASDGEITITITCTPNATYDPRSTTITLKVEELTETIFVSQDAGLGLIVSPTTFDLTNAEQTIEIEVQKNIQYSVAIDEYGLDWIKQGGTKALSTDKVSFRIAANTGYDKREGRITFKQLDGNLSGTVIVRQNQTDGLYIANTNYTISNEAQTLSIEVNTNIDYVVVSEADWIKYTGTKALKKSTILLSVESNFGNSFRTGIVAVKQDNGNLSGSIIIKQRPTPTVSTLQGTNIGLHRATFNGCVSMEDAGQLIQEVGFIYSSKETTFEGIQKNGTSVESSLNSDLSFEKKIAALESDAKYYYISYVLMDNKYYYGKIQTITTPALSPRDVPEGAVELGMTVLWAKCNIGASKPEEYGNYYAWGETETKSFYIPGSNKYWDSDTESFSKYNTIDNLMVLEPSDDVAHVVFSGRWRMPTEEDCIELIENCEWIATTLNGVKGYEVKSRTNGNSIFLPSGGQMYFYSKMDVEQICYWSSSLYNANSYYAYYVGFNSYLNKIATIYVNRGVGCAIRPVME